MFQKLSALLIVHTHNVHIFHWKISGLSFQPNHEYLDELYTTMLNHIDLITEMGLEYKENPLSLQAALDLLNNDQESHVLTDPNMNYEEVNAFQLVITIYNEIMSEITRMYDDPGISRYHKSELESIHTWYSKKANYLIAQRFVGR